MWTRIKNRATHNPILKFAVYKVQEDSRKLSFGEVCVEPWIPGTGLIPAFLTVFHMQIIPEIKTEDIWL